MMTNNALERNLLLLVGCSKRAQKKDVKRAEALAALLD